MNYLAHLLLSDRSEEWLVGALLGDFVKGRLDGHAYPRDVLAAIRLHRRIDSFVDRHAAFAASRRRISAPRRRFAGVLIDLFYDHHLAARWERYADESFAAFRARAYRAFAAHAGHLPPRARHVAAAMARDDWLSGYRRIDGIDRALRGIDRRLRRPGPLAGGVRELQRDYTGFADDFERLYPDLLALASGAR